jgi:hypothetical protein
MRTCRVCGCTDEDCSVCIQRTGFACSWVEYDLCSACLTAAEDRPPTSLFADLSDQVSGNDFLHGLADLSGDPRLKKLAAEGGVAWVTGLRIEGEGIEPVEFKREILGRFVDLDECPRCGKKTYHHPPSNRRACQDPACNWQSKGRDEAR